MPTAGNLTMTVCGACGKTSEEDEGMVGCDCCNQWYHYRCVGVTEEVKNEKYWFCPDEHCQDLGQKQLEATAAKKAGKSKKKTTSGNESDKSSITSDKPSLEQKLKALEREHKAKEQELEDERFLKERKMEMERALKKKELKIQEELRAKEMQQEKDLLEKALESERKHLENMKALRRSYQDKMENVQKELGSVKQKNRSIPPKTGSTKSAIDKQSPKIPDQDSGVKKPAAFKVKSQLADSPGKSVKESKDQVKPKQTDECEEEGSEQEDEVEEEEDCKDEDSLESEDDAKSDCPEQETDGESADAEDDEDEQGKDGKQRGKKTQSKAKKTKTSPHGLGPTKAQLSARNGVTRKLPFFSGRPEEWPLFIGSYTASNEACGFSDVENLVRLQESLKGPALESVRSQLLLPKSVPKVIKKLRQLFGRPEQLLQHHLDKIKRLEPPKSDKLSTYIPFGNAIEQMCDHLEAAELTQHLVNPLLVQELVDKLPAPDKREWVRYKQKKKCVTLRTFTNFVSNIVTEACEANVNLDYRQPAGSSMRGKKEKGVFNHSASSNLPSNVNQTPKPKPCKVCQRSDHRLRFCQDFKELSPADRNKVVDKWKLCKICLNDHGKAQCKFKIRCDVEGCAERHHPLLHLGGVVAMNTHVQSSDTIFFRMIPVILHCGDRAVETLAFLDEGASVTLVEESLVDRLGVQGKRNPLTIKWTADIKRVEKESRRMNLWISVRGGNEKILLRTAQTVRELMLPNQSLNASALAETYAFLQDLPVESYYDTRPGILIGLNNVHAIAPIEARIGKIGEPIAVRSQLGWTIYGPSRRTWVTQEEFVGYHNEIGNQELHDVLKSHYAMEESVIAVVHETKEDRRAREILERTTARIGDRFETGLLWKVDDPKFPDSFPMAVQRLKQLEHRLEKSPILYDNVRNQIEEYQRKGYARLATKQELAEAEPGSTWYLPINVVLNPRKPEKVRLVWDAAATVNEISLNSQLLTGPDMLTALPSVINRFRERPVAFGGDIREMYHQIMIRPADRKVQLFVFRKSPREQPRVYVMNVATFGSKCSPCQAQYVKNRNAMEFASQYPEAAAAIIDKHYVDDYFDSTDTVSEAVQRAQEVRLIHSKGGFEIRNWVSNSNEVLRHLGDSRMDEAVHFSQSKETGIERVLGIIWNPTSDEFSFSTEHRENLKVYLHGNERPTKRVVLSCVMGFFDPLGLLTTFTIHGRILIQKLWRTGCNWDEPIDDGSFLEWKRWIGCLPEVEAARVPRPYFGGVKSSEMESLQLHIFTDASVQAYGCVAYFRIALGGTVRCSLVMARAKVAPLKQQSIPRLELMGAVLGARMMQSILASHSLPIQRCYLWTDSQTVLSWLRSDQHNYKQFVAFRVGEIHELTRLESWRKIPSRFNIADVLTKWGQGPNLASDGPWFNGPMFLQQKEEFWPSEALPEANIVDEMRPHVMFHDISFSEPVVAIESTFRWNKLVRVTGMVIRFIENCRRRISRLPILGLASTKAQRRLTKAHHEGLTRPLLREELQKAENILWKQAQHEGYIDEVKTLKSNQERGADQLTVRLQRSSSLYKLTPFLDENGVMRMGGRLQNSSVATYDEKYPIILPRTNGITRRLLQHYHEKFGHANRETVFNEVRQKFHIPKLRAVILQVMKDCIWCKVHRCRPSVPLMAPLPSQRITPGLRPFSAVGLDYLGPIVVAVGRRKEKRWICLFTCLAVRGIHLEVVHGLSSQSCLMAIRRFICKRGAPDEFFSDNGTNFRGAFNELKKMTDRINYDCAERVSSAKIKWNFIPPATPHMGGIWERLVRSVKEALKALDDGRSLTDEILHTALAEAEDMVNSRPLTYVPQESSDTSALTPNHFLRGSTKYADNMLQDAPDLAEALRDAYKRSQFIAEEMWQRWRKEYIPSINQRTRWYEEQKQMEVENLVFVVDGPNRKCWTRGIVEKLYPGSDGRIRQADVRTSKGILRRGVANLAVLEVRDGKSGASALEAPELRAGDVLTPLGSPV